MKQFLLLFLSLCLHPVSTDRAPAQVVTGLIGGEATLPCVHRAKVGSWPHSANLYWQVPPEIVVYAYYEGQTQSEYQDAKYKGRATGFESGIQDGNLSLQINNLTVHDENCYTCYFIVDNKKKHECLVWLQIAAPSSRPVIQSEVVQLGEEVNLSCHSSGGFPKPILNWTDADGNSLPIGSQVNTSVQSDPSSGLWNVTSILRVNLTINSTFRCSVYNPRTQERQDSVLWASPPDIPPTPGQFSSQPSYLVSVVIAVLVCLFVVAIITIAIVLVKRRNRYAGVADTDREVEETQIHITAESHAV